MMQLAAHDVSYRYGRVSALRGVTVEFEPGLTGLLGPNGSGKTTFLALAAGAGRPRRGAITIDGSPVTKAAARNMLGALLQSRPLNQQWVGRDLLRAVAGLRGVPDLDRAVDRILAELDLGEPSGERVATYSLAERQALMFALAVIHEPPVLLLDEPFLGLDRQRRGTVSAMIRSRADAGRTVVLSSHVLHEVEPFVDQVTVLVDGRLVARGGAGPLAELVLPGPRDVRVDCSNPRGLGSLLASRPWTTRISYSSEEGEEGVVDVTVDDSAAFAAELPGLARQCRATLRRVVPLETSLEDLLRAIVS